MNKRKNLTELVKNNDFLKSVVEDNRAYLLKFCSNNEYLLSLSGKSAYRQLKELEETGFKLNKQTYSALKLGKYYTINSFVIFMLAKYWGLTVPDMFSRDFRAEGFKLSS